MKKKLLLLSRWSFALAFGVFAFSYFLFHYLASDGTITAVYQAAANKPVVTLLFAILGVLFLFTGVLSCLIAHIFFSSEKAMPLAQKGAGRAASPINKYMAKKQITPGCRHSAYGPPSYTFRPLTGSTYVS